MSDDRYTVGRAELNGTFGHQPRETVDRPTPPSGGSAVQPPRHVTETIAETRAKTGLYEALTELVRGVTPAAITLATLLTEVAKKDSKS